MTARQQVGRLLKPILSGNPDLVLEREWLLCTPVRHLYRGIAMIRTSSADWFRPTLRVFSLCVPPDQMPLMYDRQIDDGTYDGWRWSDPEMPGKLLPMIENEALPLLRSIETLDDLAASLPPHSPDDDSLNWQRIRKFPVAIARGDIESAFRTCESVHLNKDQITWPDLVSVYSDVLQPLCEHLGRSDFDGLAGLLHHWEEQCVDVLRARHLWEPTPFPFETTKTR